MTAYYNEFDPFNAAWLRELIKAGLIAPGEVDERSIDDVAPIELSGFTQCHFFAGVGVWSYALRCAGWPDERPVWTGSCPCQPFSAAGKGAGFADERHLWPAFHHLISAVRPVVCFGEQVASADGLAWLDLVQSDVEGAGYAFGAVDTCAAGFGAHHIRQRLYWVADSASARRFGEVRGAEIPARDETRVRLFGAQRGPCGLADADHAERRPDHAGGDDRDGQKAGRGQSTGDVAGCGGTGGLDHSERDGRGEGRVHDGGNVGIIINAVGLPCGLAHAQCADDRGQEQAANPGQPETFGPADWPGGHSRASFWSNAVWLPCRDGKARPVEPGTFPLAHGAAARVGRLRGYGNALVAAQAEGFVKAFLEVRGG